MVLQRVRAVELLVGHAERVELLQQVLGLAVAEGVPAGVAQEQRPREVRVHEVDGADKLLVRGLFEGPLAVAHGVVGQDTGDRGHREGVEHFAQVVHTAVEVRRVRFQAQGWDTQLLVERLVCREVQHIERAPAAGGVAADHDFAEVEVVFVGVVHDPVRRFGDHVQGLFEREDGRQAKVHVHDADAGLRHPGRHAAAVVFPSRVEPAAVGVEQHRLRAVALLAVDVEFALFRPIRVRRVQDVLRDLDLALFVVEHLFFVLRLVEDEVHGTEDEVPGGDVVIHLLEPGLISQFHFGLLLSVVRSQFYFREHYTINRQKSTIGQTGVVSVGRDLLEVRA